MASVLNPTSSITASNLQSGARVALVGMVANVVLASVKIFAGVFGNSYALIADGIESTLDIGGSVVIWGGLKLAARPPDESHPYGHGKAEPVAAVIVAMGVLAAALGLAIQSLHEIADPHHHVPAPFTLIVLVAVVITKELLYRSVIRVGKHVASTAVRTDAGHHRTDAITSIAAFIGISIAITGGPAWSRADDWAALFACVLIAANGLRLLMPALHEVMDTAPPREVEILVRAAAAAVPGAQEIEKCRIRKMGLEFYVDLHVGVDQNISVRDGHDIAHAVKNAIRRTDPRIADVLVHIEPARVAIPEVTA